jgi:hypothetical protein
MSGSHANSIALILSKNNVEFFFASGQKTWISTKLAPPQA